jgi:hypothetical protein
MEDSTMSKATTKKPAGKRKPKRGAKASAKAATAGGKKVAKSRAKRSVAASPKAASTTTKNGGRRLRAGELDGLVIGYMRKHKEAAPHTASAIAKGIKRSSGAVANCLGRKEKEGTVQLVGEKPRSYALKETD